MLADVAPERVKAVVAGLGEPSRFAAIDNVVRAVGRIVVCVDADAEVSTATISSLFSGSPSTPVSLLTTQRLETHIWGE